MDGSGQDESEAPTEPCRGSTHRGAIGFWELPTVTGVIFVDFDTDPGVIFMQWQESHGDMSTVCQSGMERGGLKPRQWANLQGRANEVVRTCKQPRL